MIKRKVLHDDPGRSCTTYDNRGKPHQFCSGEVMYLKSSMVKSKTEKDPVLLACIKKGCFDSIHSVWRGNESCGQQ